MRSKSDSSFLVNVHLQSNTTSNHKCKVRAEQTQCRQLILQCGREEGTTRTTPYSFTQQGKLKACCHVSPQDAWRGRWIRSAYTHEIDQELQFWASIGNQPGHVLYRQSMFRHPYHHSNDHLTYCWPAWLAKISSHLLFSWSHDVWPRHVHLPVSPLQWSSDIFSASMTCKAVLLFAI